jgi:hypothetical protein
MVPRTITPRRSSNRHRVGPLRTARWRLRVTRIGPRSVWYVRGSSVTALQRMPCSSTNRSGSSSASSSSTDSTIALPMSSEAAHTASYASFEAAGSRAWWSFSFASRYARRAASITRASPASRASTWMGRSFFRFVMPSANTAWSGLTERSAQAVICTPEDIHIGRFF